MTTQPTDHRRAIENALRSLATEQYAAQLILDNFDQAIAKAKEEGHNACADKVLSMAHNLKGYGA